MSIRDEASISRFPSALPRPNGDLSAWGARLVHQLEAVLQDLHRSASITADWVEDRTVTVSSNYTLDNETFILVNATGGSRVITLPAAGQAVHRMVIVKKIDSSANTVTVQAAAGEYIDDANTQVITDQYSTIAVCSDGTQWWVATAGGGGGGNVTVTRSASEPSTPDYGDLWIKTGPPDIVYIRCQRTAAIDTWLELKRAS